MAADPVLEALHERLAERARHPDRAELTIAALNGPFDLDFAAQEHLLGARCEHCEQILCATWERWCPPTHVLAAASEWSPDSALAHALRKHVTECKEAPCRSLAYSIAPSLAASAGAEDAVVPSPSDFSETQAEPSATWWADLGRKWASLTGSELRDRLGGLRAGIAWTLSAPQPAPAGLRFRGPMLARAPGEHAKRGSSRLEFAIRKSIVFRPEAEDLDLVCTFSFTPADRAFKVELKNLPNVLVGKHLLLLFPNWNSAQTPEVAWAGEIPGIVPVGEVLPDREILAALGTLDAAGEGATFASTFDQCRIASEEGSGNAPDFLLTLQVAADSPH